jgi:hypothetical protein
MTHNLIPKTLWLVPSRPEAETTCQVCGLPIRYDIAAHRRAPKYHNGECKAQAERVRALRKIENYKKKIGVKSKP